MGSQIPQQQDHCGHDVGCAQCSQKGHLKLDNKLEDVIEEKTKVGDKKTKNKKNTGNKAKQKKDKAWKKVPPKPETRRARMLATTLTIGASII
jgi:hypothetical protein